MKTGLTAVRGGLLLGAATFLAACATIIHGSKQTISISSVPTGSEVTVNGLPVGTTPVLANLRRKERMQRVSVTMQGYEPFEVVLNRGTDGWVWGNIVFGGLIGLIVDASNGAMYKLSPQQITAQLQRRRASARLQDGVLYVFLTESADPSWERIGLMRPTR